MKSKYGDWFILDQKNQVKATDMETSLVWMAQNPSRKLIGRDSFFGIRISTAFLGFNHSISENRLLVFETCLFTLTGSTVINRYSSYEEAARKHRKTVKRLRADFTRVIRKALWDTILFSKLKL